MPDLTHKQIAALAHTGALDREIGTALGRALTPAEREVVDRARLVWRLKKKRDAADKNDAADRMRAFRERGATVPRRACKHPRLRAAREANCPRWLRYYLAAAYFRPFEKPHKEIIRGALTASKTGGRFVVAAERGIGKSAILWGVVLYLGLTGKQPFPVCVPWAVPALKAAMRFWKNALCFNAELDADYPEYTAPFRHSKGVAQRVSAAIWEDTKEPTGAQLSVVDGLIVFPDNRGLIGGATINGNPRGLNYATPDGRILRPTIAMIDDVQDRKTAKSSEQVRNTTTIIDGDVAGMGEAGRPFPMLMSGNCIEADDVMHYYLRQQEWGTLRVPCVEVWPIGWDDDKSDCRQLWQQWERKWHAKDGERAFYRVNKTAMVEGMKLSAPAAFKAHEKQRDARYAAMALYYQMGAPAFMAEKQQQPEARQASMYELSAEVVASRVHAGRKVGRIPADAKVIVAATDLNHYGLHTAVIGFANDQTGWIAHYVRHDNHGRGLIPKKCPEMRAKQLMAEALEIHGREIAAMPLMHGDESARVGLWMIDAGYMPDVVKRYIEGPARELNIPVMACRGYQHSRYRPSGASTIGQPREQCHHAKTEISGHFIAFNVCYWREVSQRGWLASPNSPGSLSLPVGHHGEFADQVTRERLIEKLHGNTGTVWIWHTAPGWHDWGDCLYMCYVGAAWSGIGTGGRVTIQRKARRPRGARHVRIR